jgi:hypothetical protein
LNRGTVRETRPRKLMEYAAASEALSDALTACDVTNSKELGKLLSRLVGIELSGVQIEREMDETLNVVIWRVRVCGF